MGKVEREDCSSGDKEDSRTALNASIWEGWKAPKFSLSPLKVPAPTPSPGVVAGSCCPLRSLLGQLHRRQPGWAAPGPGRVQARAQRPGRATALAAGLGSRSCWDRWSWAAGARQAPPGCSCSSPTPPPWKTNWALPCWQGGRLGSWEGAPALAVLSSMRRLSRDGRSQVLQRGVESSTQVCRGGKLHSPCKCPSMVLEEREKEGKPVFFSMHGRTGEAGRRKKGKCSLMSAF